jgi:predicted nuclease of predicted toxin-antitoxin system
MLSLLIDENFNQRVLRELRRRLPVLDYLLAQEVEVFQQDDLAVLAWAATHNRVVITHDVNTMTKYAYARLEASQHLPGVIIVPKEMTVGNAIEELVILLTCSQPEEFLNRVIYLPL